MVQGRGRLGAAAAILALVTTSLGACSNAEDDPTTRTSPTPSASLESALTPSPTSTAAAVDEPPPAPEPPRARKGPAGQKAFARFVMDAWSWSLRTNDADPLLEVSLSRKQPCRGCEPLQRELANRAKEGWYVDFAGLGVDRIKLRRAGTDVVAVSTVDIPESDAYFVDGGYRSTSPAHPNATFRVRMRLVDGEYRLVSFSVV